MLGDVETRSGQGHSLQLGGKEKGQLLEDLSLGLGLCKSPEVMISATFGDEMWNTQGVGMTQAVSSPVC